MTTESQLRIKALRLLGVLGVGRTPTSAQDNDMKEAYTEVYAELDKLNLVEWAEGSDIPAEFVDTVANLIASKRIDEYGVAGERYQRIMGKALQAEITLSRLIASDYVSDTTSFTDY